MNKDERLRILYIDDDTDSFEMLRVMLNMSSIDVVPARSMSEGLNRAGSDRFDLYLIDNSFPDGDGISLCRTLHAVDPAVPVLFYSGRAHGDEISEGMAAGAAGYVTKPNSDQLAVTIVRLVRNYHERMEPSFTEVANRIAA